MKQQRCFSCVLIVTLLFGGISFTNIDSVESKVNKSTVSSSSKSDSNSAQTSGYKKDVKVIDSQYEFIYKKFEAKDFSAWYDLLIQAITYESFFKYLNNNYITRTGEVLRPLDNGIHPGSKITLESLTSFSQQKISLYWLYDMLIKKEVLTEKGYINKTEFFTGNFEQYDFSFLLEAIKTIDIPVNDARLADELKNELYNLMLAKSKVLVVNKLETTRYESNKNGFIDNLVDGFVGNIVGGIFYPDKIQTQKTTVSWSSNLDLDKYFSVYYLFNDHAFAHDYGLTRPFGKHKLAIINYSLLRDEEKNLFNDTFSFRSITTAPIAGKNAPFIGYGLSAYSVRNVNEDSFQFYNLFGSIGGLFPASSAHVDFGLSYKRGNPNGLGFYWGYGLELLMFNPLSVFFEHNGAFQPKYFEDLDEIGSNWNYFQIQAGLKAHIGQLSLGVGYQWSTGLNGWTASGTFVF